MSMRLLISGSRQNPNTIGSFITRNFDGSFAWEILSFPDAYAAKLSSIYYKLINRIWPAYLVHEMDDLFLKQVQAFKPTVILIFKGMEISKRSLEKISALGIKLVNYNFDHPYDFFSRGTGNRFVKEAIPYYDLHISYSTLIAEDLRSKFGVKVACIPFGFHLTQDDYDDVIRRDRPEINEICFVGNPDLWRIDLIQMLLSNQMPVNLYGFGWEKHFSPSALVKIHLPRKAGSFWTDPIEFWEILRQYRVQLNFFRPHNRGSHNLRTFEVPAAGGILLTPESQEQSDFFDVNSEVFCYKTSEELLLQCQKLLSMDKTLIDEVRKRARLKSTQADYSYTRRTRDLLNLLQNELDA